MSTSIPGAPRSSKRIETFALAILVALLLGRVADAGSPAEARTALDAGRLDTARELLFEWLLQESDDPAALLEATRVAVALKDTDLVERVQGRTESTAQDMEDARLDLALGLAYHALASERLAQGSTSPTLSMLFADAEARAQAATGREELWGEATQLLAQARWAQGDVEGAIEALARVPPMAFADLQLLRGRLLYDRAVTQGLDAGGRPSEDGRRDLREALGALSSALVSTPLSFEGQDLFDLWITIAWAAHRVGQVGVAQNAYELAWLHDAGSEYPLRGLRSLLTSRPAAFERSLERVVAAAAATPRALDALATARATAGDEEGALAAVERRVTLDEEDPEGWVLAGRVLLDLGKLDDARGSLVQALRLDPASDRASALLDRVARSVMAEERDAGMAVYEELLALRPTDPYVRNNFGFLLRELVSPHTEMLAAGIQVLKPEASADIRALLDRSVEVYGEAAALVDDGIEYDEITAWNLAGIVNDYGLMLHYFQDVQDATEAERQYLRALEMTDYAFMDTYLPNLRRLYTTVLPDRHLALYRIAREAQDAILVARPIPAGGFTLVPDEAKRRVAAQDVARLRSLLHRRLKEDANDDGASWPPVPLEPGSGDSGR